MKKFRVYVGLIPFVYGLISDIVKLSNTLNMVEFIQNYLGKICMAAGLILIAVEISIRAYKKYKVDKTELQQTIKNSQSDTEALIYKVQNSIVEQMQHKIDMLELRINELSNK
jgi:hypothetical protein